MMAAAILVESETIGSVGAGNSCDGKPIDLFCG